MTAAQAKDKIKALPEYTAARELALTTAALDYSDKFDEHITNATIHAEFEVTHPLVLLIHKKASEEQDPKVVWPASCKL